jgi:hypothetical protein
MPVKKDADPQQKEYMGNNQISGRRFFLTGRFPCRLALGVQQKMAIRKSAGILFSEKGGEMVEKPRKSI